MLLRLSMVFSLATVLFATNAQDDAPCRCEPQSVVLSEGQIKALVGKTEPIFAPCCADMLRISRTVVLVISVDPRGSVSCLKVLSGPPLVFGVTTDSVGRWKFRPYVSKGAKKAFCGHLALRIEGNEHGVKYEILQGAKD